MSARRPVRSAITLGVALVIAAVFSAGAQADPGDLDLTFSGDGKQTTDFGSGSGDAAAIVGQPDGKIVVVGSTRRGFALTRYNPNGSLDTSFSGDGRQATDFFDDYGDAGGATGVALEPDGKIVAVGYVIDEINEFADFALARYNPDGSLDTSFSGNGKQTTQHGFGSATGVAIQANGKIVAVGGGNGDFALARFNANGSLDTSFSGDGLETTDFFGADDRATGVGLQGDGKIVAVGQRSSGAGDDFALARYNANGSLDTSFSGDGKQTTDFGFGADDGATAVAHQGNGKIVAVGRAGGGATGNDFALARYNPNGSLDTSFSGDGKRRTDFGAGSDDRATGVGLQGDGKIVAVGQRSSGAADDFALARYNTDGSLDTSFSGDGKQTTDFGGSDGANGVAIKGHGKIVAVGDTLTTTGQSFALARYNPDGSLDTSFSGNGKERTFFPGSDRANGMAIQADGKIVTVGQTGDQGDFALARHTPNGSLDPSFSGDGKQTTDFGGIYGGLESATGVAIQGDGKIVAVGVDGDYDFALARYNPNGSLDTSFSGDGKQTTDFGGNDVASDVAIEGGGKIVVVGRGGGSGDFALARYNPNGSLDPSFSGDGKQTTDFGASDGASDMAIQADGRIVAVGQRSSPAGDDFALARYNPNGSLDTSFSGDGKQRTDFGTDSDAASGVALQADGKIVAVGRTGDYSDFALARYNPNGSLDPSFSGDGKQRTDFGAPYTDAASGVALQGDGKIVAVGSGGVGEDFALARYNPDGSLDTSFSGDGKQTTGFGSRGDGAAAVALQGDGKIVAAGSGGDDFALARYLGG